MALLYEDKSDDFFPVLPCPQPCRLCGSLGLGEVLDLGVQAIGSYFPLPGEDVPKAPLRLMRCPGCSLVQLSDGCDHEGIYRSGNYGYRSGQNPQMVAHLRAKAEKLTRFARLEPYDLVCDIGCNDGTFLGSFDPQFDRVGFDPTSEQFVQFYPPEIARWPELFSAQRFREQCETAKLITSLSVLYDVEDPVAFAQQIAECLADDGLWHFEQCYLPTMLEATGYDTICHEHLTYFTIKTVQTVLDQADMHIVDVELNDVNGGSFAVTAAKNGNAGWLPTNGRGYDHSASRAFVERDGGLRRTGRSSERVTEQDLSDFVRRAHGHRAELAGLVDCLNADGERVGALGASTKGNTLLQWLRFGPEQIAGIGEINRQKIGRVTPGSQIPILSEDDVQDCSYLLVLPWHFRTSIIRREQEFLERGGRLIFPLPEIEIV